MMILADLIMLTWNHLKLTKRAIQSIRECTTAPYRLIVVDNGSMDGTKEWLAEQDDITVISNETNRGVAPACNQGLIIAGAPYIAILNNDIEVDTGWLKMLIEGLEANPGVGCIGPLSTAKQQRQWEGYHRADSGVVIIPYYLATFCTVFRREVIEQIGLFDEQFTPAYGEDGDYWVRMKRAGWKQAAHCDVLVKHDHGSTTTSAGQQKYRQIASQKLCEKWPGEGF